jgi:AICAR transformylase/IMP cyclohydrolase PurH
MSAALDVALQDLRAQVIQSAAIANLATKAIRDNASYDNITSAWVSLTAAHAQMGKIAARLHSSETVLLGEVPHGEY